MLALDDIVVPPDLRHMRRFALDGALLLFDRRTGWTALCDGDETSHLRMTAPRVVQFGITNVCNLACTFCSRSLDARSEWTVDSAFDYLATLAEAGTLEVAFGGGEPLVFRDFPRLVKRLSEETPLAVSFTTNGTRLSDDCALELAPYTSQVRLSLYDNVDHRPPMGALQKHRMRFGINYLVTPARLPELQAQVLSLVALGCEDILLLSYNGRDADMHLSVADTSMLAERVRLLSRALRGRCTIKLDICFGERMDAVPQLLNGGWSEGAAGCPAGREFVVVTSDRRVAACSFHHRSFAAASAEELLMQWRDQRDALASAAQDPGCARAASEQPRDVSKLLPLYDGARSQS
ncbi:MAG: MoaA/NifB/PqqE/SkfB family radical SAM enzyme [Polyangiales bacterium]|jgi:MoaA/NifB/PqqE/SkfB family radical SAM enzyme